MGTWALSKRIGGGEGGGGKKSYFAGKINVACYQIMKMRNFLLRVFQKTQRINIA